MAAGVKSAIANMNLAFKSAWLLLTVLAVLSLFMPGDAGIVAALVLHLLYFPLGLVAYAMAAAFFNMLHFLGWSPQGDAQWLVLNVVLMLILSGAGYLQWSVLFPRIWKTLRSRRA